MAITARKLRRLEAWSDWRAAGGTRQAIVDDAITVRGNTSINDERISVTVPLGSAAAAYLGSRKVITVDQADARTNLILWSQEADNAAWTNGFLSITANATTAPDGTTTADKITENDAGVLQAHTDTQFFAGLPDNTTYTWSRWFKAAERGWAVLSYQDKAGTFHPTWFDITTGAVGVTSAGNNATIVADPRQPGWFRASINANTAAGATTPRFLSYIATANNVAGYIGTVGSGIYVWGAQLELGLVATDYIPTAAAAVTVDLAFDEYKIIDRGFDDEGSKIVISAASLKLTDLASAGLIFRKDSDGVVVYDFEILALTATEHINNWVIPALTAAGYSWITLGTVSSSARFDMTYSWDTPLSALIRIAEAAVCELDIARNGTSGYTINIVPKINSSAQRADLRTDKNLVNVTRVETSVEQATRVAPRGAAQDEFHATMARAIWKVSALAGTTVTLSDPAGGAGPLAYDNQLNGKYLRKTNGTLTLISTSTAATQQVVVASAANLAVNDLVEFRADSAGADLTYLDNPAAITEYGIKVAIREVDDVPATNNLIKNPVMRTWPGTLPDNWTAVNAPTIAKQVAAPFTALGGASIKVTSTADGQGVVSDAVSIFPTAANPYASGFAKVWVASGNVRVELLFTTPSGTKVWPALPDVASATGLGQWLDLGESGYDANAAGATAVAIRVVQHSAAASVFYVDAAQATLSATQQPFFEGSGGTRLWQEANAALLSNSNPVASYTVPLADLEAYDPVKWSESALIIGADARIVDPRLGIDLVTRIVGIERDYMEPGASSITLSNKPQDLTDIMATVSRPERAPGASDPPLTNPQQPKLSASFDINGQLIINSFGDNDVVSQRIAWATGSAPSAATVRAATPINQQNISGLATGSTYVQGTTVFIAAFAYNARGFESSPLAVISESRQGAIIDYTPFASSLTPIKLVSSLPGSGAFVGETVFNTTTKKLWTWNGTAWVLTVEATDITGQIQTAQIADSAVTSLKIGAAAVIAGKIAANAVGSTEIASLSVTNAKIAANAVDTGKLAANAVTTTELNALAVTNAKIAALAVDTAQLNNGAVTAVKILAHSVTANEIAALTITANEIAAGAITTGKILAGSVTALEIAANTITAAKIAALTITAAEIATGAITAAKISAGAITAGKISIGTGGAALNSDPMTTDITAWDNVGAANASIVTLTDGKVGPTALRSSGYSIYESHRVAYDPTKSYRVRAWARKSAGATGVLYIGVGVFNHAGGFANGTNYNYIAASAATPSTTWTEYQGVLGANLSWSTTPETISIVLLLDYNIAEAQYMEVQDVRLEEVLPGTLIQDGAIITNKLAANAVTAAKIAADTITAAEIQAGAITSSELAANSVIAGKVAALSITAAEIAALTITGAKIAAGTITADKLVANSITAGQIQAGAISATELAAGAVTAGKIAAGAITATEISVGTITADRIVANSIGPSQTVGRGSVLGYKTNSQSISSSVLTTLTQLTLDNSEFTLGSGVTRSGNQFIVNDSIASFGSWMLMAQVGFAGNANGDRHVEIRKNGTVVGQTTIRACAGGSNPTIIPVHALVSGLALSDAFDVYVSQDSGSLVALRVSRTETFFSMTHFW